MASLIYGVKASTFNALGVPNNILREYDLDSKEICGLITRYNNGDILTILGERFILPNPLGKEVELCGRGSFFKRHGDFESIIDELKKNCQ